MVYIVINKKGNTMMSKRILSASVGIFLASCTQQPTQSSKQNEQFSTFESKLSEKFNLVEQQQNRLLNSINQIKENQNNFQIELNKVSKSQDNIMKSQTNVIKQITSLALNASKP